MPGLRGRPQVATGDRGRQDVPGDVGRASFGAGMVEPDLFGLHTPPANPHPSYSRLSRYDATGLVWLLQGRPVIALTADTAAIESPKTGSVTVYRKHNKPALWAAGR